MYLSAYQSQTESMLVFPSKSIECASTVPGETGAGFNPGDLQSSKHADKVRQTARPWSRS